MEKSTIQALEKMLARQIPESIPNLLVQVSRDGILQDIILIGPSYENLELDDFLGRNIAALIPAEIAQRSLATIAETLDSGQVQKGKSQLRGEGVASSLTVWYIPLRTDSVLLLVVEQAEGATDDEEFGETTRGLTILQSASVALSHTLVLDQIVREFADGLRELTGAEEVLILQVTRHEESLVITGQSAIPPLERKLAFDKMPLAEYPVLERIVEERAPFELTGESAGTAAENALFDHCAAGTLLVLPIVFQKQLIGLAFVGKEPVDRRFSEREKLFAQLLTNQAAGAIVNAHLYEGSQKNLAELRTLNAVTQRISSSLDLEETLQFISESAQTQLGAQAAMIALLDSASRELEFVSFTGDRASHLKGRRMPLNTGLMGWVVRNGRPLLSNDVPADSRYYSHYDERRGAQTQSVVAAPLLSKEMCIGVIAAIDRVDPPFSDNDLQHLLSLAAPAAAAIENAHLYALAQTEIQERVLAEAALAQEREELATRVADRTRELTIANQELKRAARMKDEFLASMSHELRTPLNAILGLSEGLLEGLQGSVNEQQAHSLDLIEKSGRRLLAMIEDILDVAKIGSGRLEITPEIVETATICNASLQFVRTAAGKKQINLSHDLTSAPRTIFADSRRLKQILVNLLTNAVKFTPEGGSIELHVTADDEFVHFTVSDTGIGIPSHHLPRLFEPFTQLDSTLERHYDGTGLGLYLVRQIAEMHDGQVAVESKMGEGSQFTVSLPVHTNFERYSGLFLEEEDVAHDTSADEKITILLVEDDDINRSVYTDFLTMKGFRVVGAADGFQAVERCRSEAPQLILMDINLPGMSGLDAIAQIRSLDRHGDVPIVALTAMSMPQDREKCLAAGADEFLNKPVPLRTIHSLIDTLIAQRLGDREE